MCFAISKAGEVDGLSSSLIGAIGKLKGYFARICLVLHVVRAQGPLTGNLDLDPYFTRAEGERFASFSAWSLLIACQRASMSVGRPFRATLPKRRKDCFEVFAATYDRAI